jgi:beta-lactamase regulating signal transducer with metallopeptidase domain
MAPVADRQLSSASRIPIGLTGADHAADDTRVDRMQSAALSKMFESRTVASAMPATLGRVAGLAGVAWLLVSAFFLVRLARSCLALRLICRGAVAVDRPTAVLCEKLAMSFGIDCPDLRQSPFVASPCAVGILRPTILLSDDENVLDVSDVLAHELAHVARRDGLWNLLRHAATSCLFMQPLVWKLSRCIESTAEEICDDCAVELGADRIRYAEQLCSLAALSLPFRAVTDSRFDAATFHWRGRATLF